MTFNKTAMAALVGLSVGLAACGSEVEVEDAPGLVDQSGDPLSEVIAEAEGMSALAGAFETTGLNGVLEGEASYTVLAPGDAAFGNLEGTGISSEESGALVAAVLREHMMPGALTVDAIRDALNANGGEVSMPSYGSGKLTFTLDGDAIKVRSESGATGTLTGSTLVASNGVVLPVDAVLTDAEALASAGGEGE